MKIYVTGSLTQAREIALIASALSTIKDLEWVKDAKRK